MNATVDDTKDNKPLRDSERRNSEEGETWLCETVDFHDRAVIDPQLVPREKAEASAYRLNKRYPRLVHMALDVRQLAHHLEICGVDSTKALDIANEAFSGNRTDIFVVFYSTGVITNW